MKKIYKLYLAGFLIFSIATTGFSQLADGSFAPDFTAEDINGVEYNLHDLLDEGKTVVLDVFATWCPPCWSYHNTHALADFYNMYGPDGTNEVYVFGIEADPTTNVECITNIPGCNSTTLGDWTEGVPYPVIDSEQIGDDFEITYFPTIFMIYPNRLTYEVGRIPVGELADIRNNYDPLQEGIHPRVLNYSGFNGSLCNDLWPVAPGYTVVNYGEETINSCDITVLQNGAIIYEESWSGTAESYDLISEFVLPAIIATENVEFELLVDNINGDPDASSSYFTGVTLEVNSEINISVTTDDFAEAHQNKVEILTETGELVYTLDLSEPNKTYNETVIMPDLGCYSIKFYDSGQDGIDGELSVKDGDGWYILRESIDGPEFGFLFNVTSSGLSSAKDLLTDVSLDLYPNPAVDKLNLNLESKSSGEYQLTIFNHLGQQTIAKNITLNSEMQSSFEINLEDYNSGIYLLSLRNDEGILSKKFMVK